MYGAILRQSEILKNSVDIEVNMICTYCDKNQSAPRKKICTPCELKYTLVREKKCIHCNTLKNWDSFHKKPDCLFSLASICRFCASLAASTKENKFDNFFSRMWQNCKGSASKKENKGRMKAASFILTLQQLKDKWTSQGGRCAYSNIPMNYGHHCHFKVSPERLDNTLSYTDDNVVLIIAELNIGQGKQFDRELLLDLCQPDELEHPQAEEIESLLIPQNIIKKTPKKRTDVQTKIEGSILLRRCNTCLEFKPLDTFYKNKSGVRRECKKCDINRIKVTTLSVTGKLGVMLRHAKHKTKLRNKNIKRRPLVFELTMDMLKIQLIKQKGKCFYSGKNLTFDGTKRYHISLERLNVDVGYISTNVVFICEELNSTNSSSISALHGQEKLGHNGWEKEKFAKFCIEVKNNGSISL